MISRPDDHSMIIMLEPIGHGGPDMIARLSRSDALMPHYLGINAYRACSEKPGARLDEPRTKRRSTGTRCRVWRERDSLARSLSYLFSWREMLSCLPYLPPYRTLSTLLPEADKITGTLKDTMLFWLMQQVEHHRHSRVPRRASMTCTCPATPPPRATASSDYDAPSCYLLPGTSYLLPPTNNRLLHHSTLVCPPMTARERTVRKLPPPVPYLLDFHFIHPSSSGTRPGAARAGTPLQASQPFVPPLT